jgi:predicted house-cleaning noncanonical NTP pyrophosphatase (MazG superfamily)
MTREFDKLVRDGIPRIIDADGETPETHVADDEEYAERLVDKLEEEVAEYREGRRVEELADILEVLHAIREQRGVTVEELREMREQKATERGRFEERIVLERVVE